MGNVVNFAIANCSECNNRIKIINHVQEESKEAINLDIKDYINYPRGGLIQQQESIVSMHFNGSINQVITLLYNQACMKIAYN
jgi:hypothetical protein